LEECHICCHTGLLVSTEPLYKATWQDLQKRLDPKFYHLGDSFITLPPCGNSKHAICASCFRRSFLGPEASEAVYKRIGDGKLCLMCDHETPRYLEAHLRFLLNGSEYQTFQLRDRSINQRDWVFSSCPSWCSIEVPTKNGPIVQTMKCPFETKVKRKCIDRHSAGTMVLHCPSAFCKSSWCYDCNTQLWGNSKFCPRCFRGHGKQPSSPFLYGKPMTRIEIVKGIQSIIDDAGSVTCPGCKVKLYKTSQCNSLTHCGYHICFVCRFTTDAPFIPLEHWDEEGVKGCPRWDTSPYWNKAGNCGYSCEYDACFSDDSPCKDESHKEGRLKMEAQRQVWAVLSLLHTVPRGLIAYPSSWVHPSSTSFGEICDWFKDLKANLPAE